MRSPRILTESTYYSLESKSDKNRQYHAPHPDDIYTINNTNFTIHTSTHNVETSQYQGQLSIGAYYPNRQKMVPVETGTWKHPAFRQILGIHSAYPGRSSQLTYLKTWFFPTFLPILLRNPSYCLIRFVCPSLVEFGWVWLDHSSHPLYCLANCHVLISSFWSFYYYLYDSYSSFPVRSQLEYSGANPWSSSASSASVSSSSSSSAVPHYYCTISDPTRGDGSQRYLPTGKIIRVHDIITRRFPGELTMHTIWVHTVAGSGVIVCGSIQETKRLIDF